MRVPSRGPGGRQRTITWEVEGDATTEAVRLQVAEPLRNQAAARFVTQVTIFRGLQCVGLRVAMGREVLDGWLGQAEVDGIFRPGLIRNVVNNPTLDLSVLGQKTEGRFERIRDVPATRVLAEALAKRARLPIAILQPRSQEGWKAAARLSEHLVGLAQVVTLNYVTASTLRWLLPTVVVPDGGALLVWPGMAADHLPSSRQDLEEASGESSGSNCSGKRQ
ncbi:hypothetical protein [Kitasatospora indigofera]|nr:hypothetical protein [Kitasatospora indigofera]